MKFVSIDIETTGLDPETCDVIEIGAIIDTDNETPLRELPQFRFLVYRDTYQGEPYALAMHPKLFKEIVDNKVNGCWPAPQEDYTRVYGQPFDFARTFGYWLDQNGVDPMNFVVAGKNFANFDARFLSKMIDYGTDIRWHHRILDPTSMFVRQEDEYLPGILTCFRRASIEMLDYEGDPHTSLYDAASVVALIRQFLNGEQTNG